MTPTDVTARSFVDLRAFADASMPAPGDFLHARTKLAGQGDGLSVMACAPQGAGLVTGMPADEFLIVLTGELNIGANVLGPDACIVMPRGSAFSWAAAPGTRAIAMRCDTSTPGAQTPVVINPDPIMAPSAAPSAAVLVGPAPTCHSFNDYKSANGELRCGTWSSTPYARRAVRYDHAELMYLIEGSVTLVDGAGREKTFVKGDIFFVERGAECAWDNREMVKKVYVIFRPA
ncbi:cupin domain-containing protein [Komagataeibacter europaeus]|uniref:cupin domain-containing protein n=1 Tax=Komagataeibacter europaeus TaxID=33995 RepID=UPI00031905A0|nr:cupin domain-containing protein [Komagataeibacter europaeus]